MPTTDGPASSLEHLPRQLTSFIGRERELRELTGLLENSRLLTLTGPGGSGKTRLGLQLAVAVADAFPDGVFYVALAPVGHPDLVLSSIAQGIGLLDAGDRPLPDRLHSHLRNARTLILLDNFEHLIAAAPVIAHLLRTTAALRVVVTSRAPLHVSGEQEYEVPPLRVPDPQAAAVAMVADCESVRLFTERARAAWPGFVVDEQNAAVIAGITQRLDGLPLAIELAAARIKLLPPAALLTRLEKTLPVLVSGARDLPERQQTLRGTIAWSYGLLGAGAGRLLATCSVFRGGISLPAAESVCAAIDLGIEVLDGLEELVDQSLLRRVDVPGDPRFGMLFMIREYAAERLAGMPERDRIEARHAATFLTMAEAAAQGLRGRDELEWLDRLEAEHQNVRAALDWYARHEPRDALRLAAAMSRFWGVRGHFTEGRQRLTTLLGLAGDATSIRVKALNGAASLAIDQGDYRCAGDLLGESIRLSQELGYRRGEAMALTYLARSLIAGGRPAEAEPHVDRALRLLDGQGDPGALAIALLYAGLAAQFSGQPREACARHERCVETARAAGYRSVGARSLQMLGHARLELGDVRGARGALEEALPTCLELGDRWVIPLVMAGFAEVAACTGRPRRALRLAGVARGLCEAGQFSMPAVAQARLERWLAPARKQLGSAAAQVASEGERMSLAEAASYALADEPEDTWHSGPRRTLTRRELEVASLVAQGLTNRSIAGRLHLSVRTVDTHVEHVLTKLGFSNRAQLVAWAYESKLAPGDT
ncbi:MAG TPA: LuxR C-terminal-related transcriptional regulator [Streptosporangiaceae bacterium]|nr:LuxR C-terminal-related transcriptional regulator [Streptosporangiaceae bacterium]